MAQTVRALSHLWSHSAEVKSDLISDKERTEARMTRAARGMLEGWYADTDAVIFDKGRFWNHAAPLLHQLFPEAHLFVCVRDLRAILASIEKQHSKNPMIDEANTAADATLYTRADKLFSPNGLVGQQIMGVEDLLRRNLPYVTVVQYETFVRQPQIILDRIYSAIGEPSFDHDFDHVENTATDVDGLYGHKFPHDGSGKIEPKAESWQTHVPPDVAQVIMQTFAGYNQAFGYQ